MSEDDELWDKYIKQEAISPIDKPKAKEIDPPTHPEPVKKVKANKFQKIVQNFDLPALSETIASLSSRKLDRKTDEKIKKGAFPIEGKLDLHGMRQEEAYNALCHFIETSHAQQKRFVLVITGKGKQETSSEHWTDTNRGILKQRVPDWLSSPPCNQFVLKISDAQPKDGGTGALYIYLKRQK